MAIIGVFTDIGVLKARQAQLDQGFKIYPTEFGVSRTKGVLASSRTSSNAGLWYSNLISSRVVIDDQTIKFVCTIPPGAIPPNTVDTIREIYIFGRDSLNVQFLFAIGQVSTDILYDPTGSVTLDLELSITNVDLTSLIVFEFTQATEIAEHESNPNAHEEITDEMNRAGLFLTAGAVPFSYAGQMFDKNPRFQGVRASGSYGGLTFNARYEGTPGNSIALVFNGIKTSDEVRAIWNAAHPTNPVDHNGTGSEVLAAGTLNLAGGSLAVDDKDLVYQDVDGFYKQAFADGTIRAKVVGMAYTTLRLVRSGGFHDLNNSFTVGDDLFLSQLIGTEGKISSAPSNVKVGVALKTGAFGRILLANLGSGGGTGGGGTSNGFDAVVTDTPGLTNYPTTQQAIAATPDGGSILVAKLEFIHNELDTLGKALTFVADRPHIHGWTKYLGTQQQLLVTFSLVPTSGTWRIEFNGNESTDLAFNANAAAVQAAFLALPTVPVGSTVTGNYGAGFLFDFNDNLVHPNFTFVDPGDNSHQHLAFSNVPDDGTFKLHFKGEDSANIPWESSALEVQNFLLNMVQINDVTVTGSFAAGFDIIFINADGHQAQPIFTLTANTLKLGVTNTSIFITEPTVGTFPSNHIKNGINPIVIQSMFAQAGTPIGDPTCIMLTKDHSAILGQMRIENFINGVDVVGHKGIQVDADFLTTPNPFISSSGVSYPDRDYKRWESTGIDVQRVVLVGAQADYATLQLALPASQDGDKIIVTEDQTTSVPLVISGDIEIEFANKAKMIVTAPIAGNAITFGAKVRTKNWHTLIAVAGTYGTAHLFTGAIGHHENIFLELSGNFTILGKGFQLAAGSLAVYIDGVITIGTATITNVLFNSSGILSHNVNIRDKDNGMLYTLYAGLALQEQPTGFIDGINASFHLSQLPIAPTAVFLFVDAVPQRQGPLLDYTISGQTITFLAGKIPEPGTEVYAFYLAATNIQVPPLSKGATIQVDSNLVPIHPGAKELNFIGANVVQDNADRASVIIPVGAGLGVWKVYNHTLINAEIAAKKIQLPTIPVDPNAVLAFWKDHDPLFNISDYVIDNSITPANYDTFNWAGKGPDGIIAVGDKLCIAYFDTTAGTGFGGGGMGATQFDDIPQTSQNLAAGFTVALNSSYQALQSVANVTSDPVQPIIGSAVVGRTLLLENVGVFIITLKTGGNVELPGGVDLDLTPDSTAEFFWNGSIWKPRAVNII